MEHIIRNALVPDCSSEVEAKLMLFLVKGVDFHLKIFPDIDKIDIDT